MIEKNIVFITGAGSSIEFGFPSGGSLIMKLLDEKWTTINNESFGIDISEDFFKEFKMRLKFSNTPSIDIFIANNPEFADLSKALIAKNIASIEEKSINGLVSQSWLKYLWTKMIEGCLSFDKFKNNNIKFITFNYDRTLEYFFTLSSRGFFNIDIPNLDFYNQLLDVIPIIHVFGKVGNLPWENEKMSRTYDSHPGDYKTWYAVGQELKTIYESKESPNQNKIINFLKEADEVHFLGFGFNSFNIDLLGINQIDSNKFISGSRFDLSNSEIDDINYLHSDKFKKLTIHSHHKCYDYLKYSVNFFAKRNE